MFPWGIVYVPVWVPVWVPIRPFPPFCCPRRCHFQEQQQFPFF